MGTGLALICILLFWIVFSLFCISISSGEGLCIFIFFIFSIGAYALIRYSFWFLNYTYESLVNEINTLEEEKHYIITKNTILDHLGLKCLSYLEADDTVYCNSLRALDNYTSTKYFKEDSDRVNYVYTVLDKKKQYKDLIQSFLNSEKFSDLPMYSRVEEELNRNLDRLDAFYIDARYSSPAGRNNYSKTIEVTLNN